MAFSYERIRDQVAAPNIRKFGKPVTLTRPGNAAGWTKSYDPAQQRTIWTNDDTDEVVLIDPAAPATTPGSGLEFAYEQKDIDGTKIKAGDKRLLVVDLPALSSDDVLTVGGKAMVVVSVKPLEPGEVRIYDEVQLR